MNILTIQPDKKLKTKTYLIFSTISLFLIILALILQFTIPLGGRVTYFDIAIIIWPILIGLVFLIFAIGIPISLLWINNLEYHIDNERITIKKGIITKIEQNIPFRAVTDFQLHRSLFDRFLNIGSIRIQTAGQSVTPSGYEANLAGLKDWQNLLEELRSRVKVFHDSKLEEKKHPVDFEESDKVSAILEELKQIRKLLEIK